MNVLKTGDGATLIGRGATLRGELVATEDVVVEGQIEGLVDTNGARFTVGKDAHVRADVMAQEVIVLGRVDGTIRATERAELRAGANVVGDVYAKRFSMEVDATLLGRVDPTHIPELVRSANVLETAARVPGEKTEGPIKFGSSSSRAGLMAAARSLGAAGTPAGMNALALEPVVDDENATVEPGA